MRLKLWLAGGALVALAVTSIAVANGKPGSVKAVSATFTATTVAHLETRTCTGADGTFEISKGTYTGIASSSEPSLNGPIELKVRSVFNTTKSLGWIDGRLKVRGSRDRSFGKVVAVNTHNTLDGFVVGEPGHESAALLGSLTASFTRTGGFTSGQIGSGSTANAAVIAGGDPCKGGATVGARLKLHGTIDSLSATSIGIKLAESGAIKTCAITSASPKTSDFKKGDRVKAECELQGTTLVLVKIKKSEDD